MTFAPAILRDRATRERWSYQARNFRANYRGAKVLLGAAIAHRLGTMVAVSALRATLTRADGSTVDLGVLSRRVVTTAGVNFLATAFINTVEPEVINYHDSGTGTTAESTAQTALVTATGNARVSGTQSNSSSNVYQTVATLAYTGTAAITEHAVFSASTTGTMWDRSVFSAINVVNGDSIAFTYQLTLTAGG